MNVKLVRKKITKRGYFVDAYDIYVGIRQPWFFFKMKWYLDAENLSPKDAVNRIWNSYLQVKGTKLITTTE